MPLTSKEMKGTIVRYTDMALRSEPPPDVLEDALDAQQVDIQVIAYNTIQIKVLPSNSGAWRYFTLKISERQ
jgi:hypothetical protein